jgi:hypothetical protein
MDKANRDMTHQQVARRLRFGLLVLAALLCFGSMIELWLQEHTQEPIQWTPFSLCGAGLLSVSAALLRPTRAALWTLRGIMPVVGSGSLLGIYEHLISNLEVVWETQPAIAPAEAVWQALHGAAPLLAPGILALAATLALMGTYQHPALQPAAD